MPWLSRTARMSTLSWLSWLPRIVSTGTELVASTCPASRTSAAVASLVRSPFTTTSSAPQAAASAMAARRARTGYVSAGPMSQPSWIRPITPKFFSPMCKSLTVANLLRRRPPGRSSVRKRPARKVGTPRALAAMSYVVPGDRPSTTAAPGPPARPGPGRACPTGSGPVCPPNARLRRRRALLPGEALLGRGSRLRAGLPGPPAGSAPAQLEQMRPGERRSPQFPVSGLRPGKPARSIGQNSRLPRKQTEARACGDGSIHLPPVTGNEPSSSTRSGAGGRG